MMRKSKFKLRKKLKQTMRRIARIFGSHAQLEAHFDRQLKDIRHHFARELRDTTINLRVEFARLALESSAKSGPTSHPGEPKASGQSEVIIVGAGGHAKVVIELLEAMGERVRYCIGSSDSDDFCLHVPVLKGDEHLETLRGRGFDRAFIAIGSNPRREQLSIVVEHLGFKLVNAISPTATVSPSAQLGCGIAVMANAVVNARVVIEDLAIINTGSTVDHDCRVGRCVHIGPQCGLAGNVHVGAGSFLGVGCSVIPGVSIGSGVSLGAGSVVVRNVTDGAAIAGVPAHRTNLRPGSRS